MYAAYKTAVTLRQPAPKGLIGAHEWIDRHLPAYVPPFRGKKIPKRKMNPMWFGTFLDQAVMDMVNGKQISLASANKTKKLAITYASRVVDHLRRLELTPVECQPKLWDYGTFNVKSPADLFCVAKTGELVVIELKTSQIPTETLHQYYRSPSARGAKVLSNRTLLNSLYTRHQMQLGIYLYMLKHHYSVSMPRGYVMLVSTDLYDRQQCSVWPSLPWAFEPDSYNMQRRHPLCRGPGNAHLIPAASQLPSVQVWQVVPLGWYISRDRRAFTTEQLTSGKNTIVVN